MQTADLLVHIVVVAATRSLYRALGASWQIFQATRMSSGRLADRDATTSTKKGKSGFTPVSSSANFSHSRGHLFGHPYDKGRVFPFATNLNCCGQVGACSAALGPKYGCSLANETTPR
jgi:hypothetical protein